MGAIEGSADNGLASFRRLPHDAFIVDNVLSDIPFTGNRIGSWDCHTASGHIFGRDISHSILDSTLWLVTCLSIRDSNSYRVVGRSVTLVQDQQGNCHRNCMSREYFLLFTIVTYIDFCNR